MVTERRKLRVLIADDESAIVRIYSIGLQHYFAPEGDTRVVAAKGGLYGDDDDDRPSAEITVCQQGSEAVELVRSAVEAGTPFDVIVLDIRMPPGISGIEAAQEIRKIDELVPLLFISGHMDFTRPEIEQQVSPPARIDLIEKPVRLGQLAARIKKLAA